MLSEEEKKKREEFNRIMQGEDGVVRDDSLFDSMNGSTTGVAIESKRREFDEIMGSNVFGTLALKEKYPEMVTDPMQIKKELQEVMRADLPEVPENTTKEVRNSQESVEEKKGIVKSIVNLNNPLADGYQFGDVAKMTKATVQDVVGDLTSGFVSTVENVFDVGANLFATARNAFGFSEAAKRTREFANKNYSAYIGNAMANFVPYLTPVGALYAVQKTKEGKLFENPFTNTDFEEDSILGETSDEVVHSMGYVLGMAKGGSILKGASHIPIALGGRTCSEYADFVCDFWYV